MSAGARFDGKVAIVTGAASAIGRAIALRLGCEGAFVANQLPGGRQRIERLGGRAFVVKADVAK
jgi:3-oxoacyl-[acyl-carrier protein] reductase